MEGAMNTTNATDTTTAFADNYPVAIVFVGGSCSAGAILRILLKKWANYVTHFKWGNLMKIPYTVFIMVIAMLLGIVGIHVEESRPYLLTEMDPIIFLYIFYPVVIFQSAYNIDIKTFWRSVGHIAMLAVPVFLLNAILIGLVGLVIPEIAIIKSFEARLYMVLLLGFVMGTSDPVAFVTLLKDLGNQNYLATLIEGEALINNGVSVIALIIAIDLLDCTTPYYVVKTSLEVFIRLLQQTVYGTAIGYLMAKLAGFILENIYNDAVAEITITMSFSYLTAILGIAVDSSGIFAVVVFGLTLDRASITPQVDHFLHRFWEILAYICNTVIFMVVGIQITRFIGEITWYDVGILLLLYVSSIVFRAVSIFAFFPIMNRLGSGLGWREVLVMSWGSLRGPMGLSLAIYLYISYSETKLLYYHARNNGLLGTDANMTLVNETLFIDLESSYVPGTYHAAFEKILVLTSFLVFLPLLINVSTLEAVMGMLGMLKVSTAQQVTMLNAVNSIQQDVKRSAGVLKHNRFLTDARWSIVENLTTIAYPFKEIPKSNAVAVGSEKTNADGHVQMTVSQDDTLKSLFEEARLRFIKALKMSYWQQYSNGMLTDQETRILVMAADATEAKPGEFIDIDHIRKCLTVEGLLPWIRSKLEDLWYGKKTDDMVPPGSSPQIQYLFRIVHSDKFEILMQVIIVINVIPIIMDFTIDGDAWLLGLQITNYVFIVIYCGEAVAKLIGLGMKQYFSDKWNWFDLFILIICFVEIIVDFVLLSLSISSASIVKTVEKALRILRMARLLRLSKTLIPKTLNFVNKRINERLRFGYAVGKGFITAEEDVRKFITSISDNKAIQRKLIRASNKNKLIVTKEMGLLQKEHPGIAISVKTKMAIRSLLNHTRDAIYQLGAGGILDETETQLLERGVENKLMKQSEFPSVVSPPSPEDLLDNISWLVDDEESRDFVKSHSTIKDFNFNDVIMREGDKVDGVHIIIYGMIRIKRIVRQSSNQDDEQSSDEDLKKQEEFLCSGNIFGEMGLLTKTVRSCIVSCETTVQTFFVSAEDMEEAFARFPALKKAIWSVVANRISVPLFLDHIKYQGTAVEKINLLISSGYIIELTEEDSMFRFTDRIDEVCIVHGTVTSWGMGDILHAPFLAMPEHEGLELHNCTLSILLVIPRDVGRDIFTDSRSLLIQNSRVVSQARLSGTWGTVPGSDVTMD